ncbi:hypothetical protein KAS08_00905 [Candidatus Pacearchaeota archaeon]|nr:hypothetical protein [Candidatus Pacearchaeota archaeon]
MAIDKTTLSERYSSGDDLIKKCNTCEYCVYEDVLKPYQRVMDILQRDLPKGDHPHRRIIEDLCGEDMDEPCDMKYAAMRAHFPDFMLGQLGVIGKYFKSDLGKTIKEPVNFKDAYMTWSLSENNLTNSDGSLVNSMGNPITYSMRWREVWNGSLNINKEPTLTELGIYRVVVSDNETYEEWFRAKELLKESEEKRHKRGIFSLENIMIVI